MSEVPLFHITPVLMRSVQGGPPRDRTACACCDPWSPFLLRWAHPGPGPHTCKLLVMVVCPTIPLPSTLNPQPSTLNPQPSTPHPAGCGWRGRLQPRIPVCTPCTGARGRVLIRQTYMMHNTGVPRSSEKGLKKAICVQGAASSAGTAPCTHTTSPQRGGKWSCQTMGLKRAVCVQGAAGSAGTGPGNARGRARAPSSCRCLQGPKSCQP